MCLYSFLGFGKKYVEKYAAKTNRHLFLHIKQVKRPRKEETQDSGIPEKVSKMAIGVEGGFSSDIKKDEYDEVSQIVIVPSHQAISIGITFIYFNKLNYLMSEYFKHFQL